MKRNPFSGRLMTAMWALFVAMGVQAETWPWESRLPFETAVIHYDVSGAQTGHEILYVRDFGREQVKVTRSEGKMLFIRTSTNTIEITTHDEVIAIDMNEKSGMRTTNPQKFVEEEIGRLSATERAIVVKNMERLGVNTATQMGGEVKPEGGKHLGYTCDIVSIAGTTSCTMSGTSVLLSMESALPGMSMKTVATKIEKNAAIPTGIFQVPDGVTIEFNERADNVSRQTIRDMIATMKDPDAVRKITEGLAQGGEQMEQARQALEQHQAEMDAATPDGERQGDQAMPAGHDVNEMMDKGMEAFRGLFGR